MKSKLISSLKAVSTKKAHLVIHIKSGFSSIFYDLCKIFKEFRAVIFQYGLLKNSSYVSFLYRQESRLFLFYKREEKIIQSATKTLYKQAQVSDLLESLYRVFRIRLLKELTKFFVILPKKWLFPNY